MPCSTSSTGRGVSWTADPLAARRAERERLIALAREYADALSQTLPLTAAVVGGSVARGDFNVWSDVDVLVVSDALPERLAERAHVLGAAPPARVEPHGYTVAEYRRAITRRDRLACEAAAHGVPVLGALPG